MTPYSKVHANIKFFRKWKQHRFKDLLLSRIAKWY